MLVALIGMGFAQSAHSSVELFPLSGEWRFQQATNLDGVAWTTASYDDSNWPTGRALLCVENNFLVSPRNTSLMIGPTTYYFRTHFELPFPATNAVATISHRTDDGAVFYLNGREVQRVRMPAAPTPVTYATLATGTPSSGDTISAESWTLSGLSLTNLRPGTNVLAVEVHQNLVNSDDIVFGCSLTWTFTNSAPVVVTQPTEVSVLDGRPAQLFARVDGHPTPAVQWFKDGDPVPGATSGSLQFSAANVTNAGTYWLVASNSLGIINTSNALLTVLADPDPPTVLGAKAQKNLTNLTVAFSEPVRSSTATNPGNYSLFQTALPTNQLSILSVATSGSSAVTLQTSPRTPGLNYTLRINGVQDISTASNQIALDTEVFPNYQVELLTVDAATKWNYSQAGVQPATNWFEPGYDDSFWSVGAAVFHGGSPAPAAADPVRTSLILSNNGSAIQTHYFRTRFEAPGPVIPESLSLHNIVDDGAVFYLNGKEAYAIGMSSSRPTTYGQVASRTVATANYEPPLTSPGVSLPATNLLTGQNVLAVEVHQSATGISDVAFGLRLDADIKQFHPRLQWSVPALTQEGAGILTNAAVLSLLEPCETNLVVQLTSSRPSDLSLPSEVTIPAGATTVTFDLLVPDNASIDGPRNIQLSAEHLGLSPATAIVEVLDNETNTLALILPPIASEADHLLTAELRFSQPAVEPLQVSLSSSDLTELSVPPRVTIPAGETSVVLPVTVINDDLLDGPQVVTLNAAVTGWPAGTATVTVADDEARTIAISLPTNVIEGAGTLVATGRVQLAGVAVSNLTVQLSSSQPELVSVVSNLTVSAGQSNAFFNLTVGDNPLHEPPQIIVISATITDFLTGSNSITVLDNDAHHFSFERIPSPQYTNTAFPVIIRALTADGSRQTNFTLFTGLAAAGQSGAALLQPTNTGSFVNGAWTGVVQVATQDRFVRLQTLAAPGLSEPFHVEPTAWWTVDLLAEDLVYDVYRQRIYASVSRSGGSYSNSVVAIDPATAGITCTLPVGEIIRPETSAKYRSGKLALSDDGQFLYVAVSNAIAVQRVNLSGLTLGPAFPVGAGVFGSPYSVADLVVLAGAPTSVAVARADGYNSKGVAVFDNGIRRPSITPETFPSINALEPGSTPGTLYGYNSQGSGFDFMRLSVSPSGVAVQDSKQGWLEGFGADIATDGGLVFGSFGAVIDPLAPNLLGRFSVESSFPGCCKYVAPDVAMGRAFFLTQVGANFHLQAHDLATFLPLKALDLPQDGNGARCLIRCGTNGLAFISGAGKVYLVRSSLLTESHPSTDLIVTQSLPGPAVAQSNYTVTVIISNKGPETASEVVLTDTWATNHAFVSATVSTGSWSTNGGKLNWTLGMLAPGSNATVKLTLRSGLGGWSTNRAVVLANESDLALADNVSALGYFVQIVTQRDSVSQLAYPANDLAFDPHSQKLFVTVPGRAGVIGNSVQLLDPMSGLVTNSIFVGNEPGRFALAQDDQYLYVTGNSNRTVSQIHLPTQNLTRQFALGSNAFAQAYSVEDMAVLPSQPEALAISRQIPAGTSSGFTHEAVAIYDNGFPRNTVGSAPAHYYSDVIEFGADASMIFAYNSGAVGFNRLAVNPQGASYVDSDPELLGSFSPLELEFAEGLLYSTSGLVVDPLLLSRVGQVPGVTSAAAVLFDPPSRRIFYLHSSGINYRLLAFEAGSLIPLGVMNISGVSGSPASLIRWGADGFAFRTSGDQLFILRSSLVPTGPPADLVTTATLSTHPLVVNSNFTYSISVSNSGPNTASNVVAFHKLPATAAYISGSSTSGALSFSNGIARCDIGVLTNGESVLLEITARTAGGGIVASVTSVASSAVDPNLSNNVVRLAVPAEIVLTSNAYQQVAMAVQDIAYNPLIDRLYVSTSSNQIAVLNPNSGLAEATWQTPSAPGLLRLTPDRASLYCSLNFGQDVARFSTGSGLIDFELPIGHAINDLEPMPGGPDSFVLARGGTFGGVVEVYDGMVRRPQTTDDSAGAWDLEFGATTNLIYALGGALSGGTRYRVMTISPSGIVESVWNGDYFTLGRLAFDGGVFYSATGQILDPPTGSVIDRFAGVGAKSLVKPETARQRVFFLNQSGANWRLEAYEPHTRGLLGSMLITNVLGSPSSLLRWGVDGFAFHTSSNQLFLGRSELVPSGAAADLALTQSAVPGLVGLGSNVTFVITVTNAGPNPVSNAVLLDRFPTNTVFVSATVSQGSVTYSANLLTCVLGTLTNGAVSELQLTVRTTAGGNIANLATVTSGNLDPVGANNSSTVPARVQLNLGANDSGMVALHTTDLAYEPNSGLIYATVTNHFGSPLENSIIAIDPATGLLGEPIPLGKSLSKLAATDDGRLYVLANDGTEFLRVNPSSRQVELTQSSLPWSAAADLKTVPGLPESVVLTPSGGAGVVVFDNSVPRPEGLNWFDEVEFYAPNQMVGWWRKSVPTVTARLGLTSNGIQELSPWAYDLIDGNMSASGGVIYTSGGSAFDPLTMTRKQAFGVTGPVAPDAALDRVAFLSGTGTTKLLRVFDTHNLLEWGSLSISNIAGTADRLIRCGADRFAFRTSGGQVFIVRSAALSTGHPAELALGTSPNNLIATVGQPVDLLLSVTNPGPAIATGLIITNLIPPGMYLETAASSSGATTLSDRELRWQIASLGVGESATNRVSLIPGQAGIFSGLSVLRSDAKDTNSLDNVTRLTWRINNPPASSALSQLVVRAADLVWDASSQRLFMSLPGDAPGFSNSVVSLDPGSGQFQIPFPVGENPGKLALSDDGQFLYVGLNATASVARVTLATRSVGLSFPLNAGYDARDIAVIPGQPGTVAIAREYFPGTGLGQTAGIAIYRDGVELPLTTPAFVESSTTITCSTNPARLYGYNGWSSEFGFRRMNVSSEGVTQLSATSGLISGFNRRIEFAAGLVFASSGTVLQPETLTVLTNIPDISANALCKPDVSGGLLTFLTQKGSAWYLRQYAHSNYALQRQIRIPGVMGEPRSLTHWGNDGLAFLTSSNQMFLVRPALAIADLAVQHTLCPTQALAGQAIELSLSVGNGGFSFEPDAVLTNLIPRQTTITAAQISQGSTLIVSNQVIWFLGPMAPHATASLTLTLQPTNVANITFTNTATVAGAFADAVPINNLATAVFAGLADTDRDGLPDDWELARGLSSSNALDALWDSDCDGLSNLQEYHAGSDPFVFEAVRLTAPRMNAQGKLELQVHAALGKSYSLETSSNMVSWNVLNTFVVRTADQPVQITPDPAGTFAFYRLRTDTNAAAALLEVVNPESLRLQPPILRISAPPGRFYTLHVSSNLMNWSVVTNFLSTSCFSVVTDPLATGSGQRFYRVSHP